MGKTILALLCSDVYIGYFPGERIPTELLLLGIGTPHPSPPLCAHVMLLFLPYKRFLLYDFFYISVRPHSTFWLCVAIAPPAADAAADAAAVQILMRGRLLVLCQYSQCPVYVSCPM